jgi:Rod binding domain-containing protein
MNITQISSPAGLDPLAGQPGLAQTQGPKPGLPERDPSELARQFEAILVRQMLAESMKSLIDGPDGQQNYGYFISEALSDGITRAGGMGLRSVLEAQLRGQGEARQAAERQKQAFLDNPQK